MIDYYRQYAHDYYMLQAARAVAAAEAVLPSHPLQRPTLPPAPPPAGFIDPQRYSLNTPPPSYDQYLSTSPNQYSRAALSSHFSDPYNRSSVNFYGESYSGQVVPQPQQPTPPAPAPVPQQPVPAVTNQQTTPYYDAAYPKNYQPAPAPVPATQPVQPPPPPPPPPAPPAPAKPNYNSYANARYDFYSDPYDRYYSSRSYYDDSRDRYYDDYYRDRYPRSSRYYRDRHYSDYYDKYDRYRGRNRHYDKYRYITTDGETDVETDYY